MRKALGALRYGLRKPIGADDKRAGTLSNNQGRCGQREGPRPNRVGRSRCGCIPLKKIKQEEKSFVFRWLTTAEGQGGEKDDLRDNFKKQWINSHRTRTMVE